MMNHKQTRPAHKALALALALLLLFSALPLQAFATDLTPVDGQPADEQALSAADVESTPTALGEAYSSDANDAATQDTAELQYRIVHLDCGRKYFSVDYIKGVIDTMAENGYNQLELAFGNGGLRFLLDDMSLDGNNSDTVKEQIAAANATYGKSGDSSYLTEDEMRTIISYAQKNGIEIVPLLNMPGHMDAILSTALFSKYKLSGSDGSLDLTNPNAVDFGKELLSMYVKWFREYNAGAWFFNFGADEYGQGIRNPYIESSIAEVSYDQLIGYMNGCAKIIEDQSMTARCFNDFVCYNGRSDCNLYKTVQVCYWSNQWGGSEYNTVDVISAKYNVINTSQKWYFVPSKADEYGKNVVLNNFNTYDVTKFQNIKSGYNSTSTTYTQIPVGTTNVGAMFCVWADTPSVDIALADVQELIAAMAEANSAYFGKTVNPDPGETTDVTITLPEEAQSGILTVGQSITLTASAKVDWSCDADDVVTLSAAAKGTKSSWNSATQVQVTAKGAGTATINASIDGKLVATQTLTVQAGDTPVVSEKTVTVVVGNTETVTVNGEDLSGTYPTEDETIASASVEYTYVEGKTTVTPVSNITSGKYYIQTSSGVYLTATGSTTTDTSKAAEWTFTGTNGSYKLSNGGNYLYYTNGQLTASGSWSTTFYFNNGTLYRTRNSRNGRYTYSNPIGSLVIISATSSEEKSDITFTGKKIGTTYVTIGNVRYTINVVAEDLTKVTLPINLWITNTGVVPTGWSNGVPAEFTYTDDGSNRRSIYILKASYTGVYSETGIELSSIVPKSGVATSWDKKTYNVVYWKSAYHDESVRQSTDGWTNESLNGTQFQYIRYWEGSWAYSVDGTTWAEISNVGAAAEDGTKNQVNIWYRQKTTITKEVQTEIVDWGPTSFEENQSLLDFAVKYETGERTPNSFPVSGKTMGFACPVGNTTAEKYNYVGQDGSYYYRTVYGIAGVETSEYEVYMITVTPNSDTHTSDDYLTYNTTPTTSKPYSYDGTEKIAWAKTETDAANSELTTTSDIKYGGEPFLDSVKIYQYQGLLVTYYVRAKQTDDSLTVHYYDETTGVATEFYSYNIIVNANTTFDNRFAKQNPDATGKDSYVLVYNTVQNKQNETQTVYADLSKLPAVAAQYRYSDYDCIRVKLTDNGKTANLYYKFNNQKSYVIDFGLPLKIQLHDLNVNLDNATIRKVNVVGATHGKTAYDESTKTITYTLEQYLSENETFTVTVTGTQIVEGVEKTGEVSYGVTVIPATNIYYEDNFDSMVKYENGRSAAAAATWTIDGTSESGKQALDELGSATANVYGYDSAYSTGTALSMGSAHKVTVDSQMVENWTNASAWPSATFTFKGTGFDIISLTDNKSGIISVDVYKGSTASGTAVKKLVVDNYYGYTQDEGGNWVVDTTASNNALYQIPVMKVDNLEYGEYTAVIKVFYNSFLDHQGSGSYSFWLDAIRIYNPMGVNQEIYAKDNEGYPQYFRLQQYLKSNPNGASVVFIDGNKEATVAEYTNYGPNNEVYLAKGQAISFELSGNISDIASVQIGAKAPKGNAVMTIGGSNQTLNTATEQYYDISAAATGQDAGDKNNRVAKQVTITNTGDGILSLTNLKVTFKTSGKTVSLKSLDAAEQAAAVETVRALYAAPAETFTPARFEASWSRAPRAGGKATLTVKTSEDVASVTVNGEAITNYRTRTESTGWLWNRKTVTYREFTYTVTNAQSASYTVAAVNASGVASDPITAKLTVRPTSNWWDRLIGWF